MNVSVLPKRFWDRVSIDPNGCWLWTGHTTGKGYGAMAYGGKTHSVHRLMVMHLGVDIPPKMYVCHKCDTPRCCNPKHLFVGTSKENHDDMVRKGRCNAPSGQNHWQAKYPPELIQQIRALSHEGLSTHAIGKRLGCGGGYVWQVLNKGLRAAA